MRDSAMVSRAKQDRVEEVGVASHGRRWRKYPDDRQMLESYSSHPFVTVAPVVSPAGQVDQFLLSDTRLA